LAAAAPDGQVAESPHTPRPASDGAALHAIEDATAHLRERAEKIRANPGAHLPKLILSQHVRGTSILDRIADGVNKFCGSMYVFIGITIGIVAWLFLGNVVGFDKTPWPLLLTILNLPQLSIKFYARGLPSLGGRGIASPALLLPCYTDSTCILGLWLGRSRSSLVACMISGTTWCGARSTAAPSWRDLLPSGAVS
jgi:hypothetical protein